MASVFNSKAKYYECDSRDSNDAEHYIESEADIFIKELSRKQLRTRISLEEQLRQEKEFHSSHSYQAITEQTSGTLAYDEFKNISSAVECQFENVTAEDTVEKRKVSRHMRELALAVKPNSTETKLLEFAITCNAVGPVKSDNRPEDHPINHLHDLESKLFDHLTETADPEKMAKTILRKRKQLLESISDPIEIKFKPKPAGGKSLWDVNELPLSVEKKLPEKTYSCQKEKLFTIRDGKIISLSDEIPKEIADEQKIIAERLKTAGVGEVPTRISEDEIKNLPKFQNYERGKPAETLYLKNLSPHVTEEDLSTWFCEFQQTDKPRIVFNLMKSGKMRGQAFIHFHCIDTATKALEKLNGCIMYGKPLIIQFSNCRRL